MLRPPRTAWQILGGRRHMATIVRAARARYRAHLVVLALALAGGLALPAASVAREAHAAAHCTGVTTATPTSILLPLASEPCQEEKQLVIDLQEIKQQD